MARGTAGRSALVVGAVVVVALFGLWLLRATVGLFVRLVELGGIAVVGVVAAYVVYELVRGWRQAG